MKILQLVLTTSLFASNLADFGFGPWRPIDPYESLRKMEEESKKEKDCQFYCNCPPAPACPTLKPAPVCPTLKPAPACPPVPVCPTLKPAPVPVCPTLKPAPACPTLKPAPVPVCPTLEPVTDTTILPKEEKGLLEKVFDIILGLDNDQTAEKNKPRSFEPRNIEELQPVNQGEIEKIEKIEKKK